MLVVKPAQLQAQPNFMLVSCQFLCLFHANFYAYFILTVILISCQLLCLFYASRYAYVMPFLCLFHASLYVYCLFLFHTNFLCLFYASFLPMFMLISCQRLCLFYAFFMPFYACCLCQLFMPVLCLFDSSFHSNFFNVYFI